MATTMHAAEDLGLRPRVPEDIGAPEPGQATADSLDEAAAALRDALEADELEILDAGGSLVWPFGLGATARLAPGHGEPSAPGSGELRFEPAAGAGGAWRLVCPFHRPGRPSLRIVARGTRGPLSAGDSSAVGPWLGPVRALAAALLEPAIAASRDESRGAPVPGLEERHRRGGGTDVREEGRSPPRIAVIECAATGAVRSPPAAFEELFPELVARSAVMRSILASVVEVARHDIPVLIEGESGTGKELIANAIHRLSERRHASFVSENCAAIPDALIEAELFGHEKGAFTGASSSRPGLIERAGGGTLFLDEVGEMNPAQQKKLLRVLQERKVRRVGGRGDQSIDFRLISATNRVLEDLVAQGGFREDLFFRLQAASISLPPLRERREDIPHLVDRFSRQFAADLGNEPLRFDPEALDLLCAYAWPGNVRELRHEVWRLHCATERRVRCNQLGRRILKARASVASAPQPAVRSLAAIEREVLGRAILETVQSVGGNLARAARILGLPRVSLYRRLERYGLKRQPSGVWVQIDGASRPGAGD